MYHITGEDNLLFLQGGGEMGQRTRDFDWSKTPVGSIEQWPQSLRTVLSLIINSKFPMFLWWGKDLIQFYNDAYRPSFGNEGKHPMALGQKGEDCWPEIWPVIKPLIDHVLEGKGATWSEDQLIPIYRNGHMEDVYWTFGYSPVIDETGNINGVLVVCNETTKKIGALKALKYTEETIRNLFIQAPVAVAILKGKQQVVEFANDRMFELWGKSKKELLNRPIFEGLSEAKGQGFEELLDQVYETGESFAAVEIPVRLPRKDGVETIYMNLLYEGFREMDASISGVIVVAIDVTRQVIAHKKIQEAEEKARMAIESAELGLYEIDPYSGVMVTDDRFKNITGYSPIASRFDFISIIYEKDVSVFDNAYKELLNTNLLNFQVRIVLPGESIRWLKVSGKLIRDKQNLPVNIYGVVQDITARKEMENEKDDFISIVSHELKTPLTAMKISTYLLTEKFGYDKESGEIVTRMDRQINRLIRIIKDLRDVTVIESNKIIFRKDNFDFSELVTQIAQEVETAKKSHRIITELAKSAILTADKERTSQVLTNLLTNAIRYSPDADKVIISVSIEDNEMICSVRDFGIGIAKEQQQRIFERFYQASGAKGNSGFGLGLYISAEIIKRQKGRIWLESTQDEGSTFYFSLPV